MRIHILAIGVLVILAGCGSGGFAGTTQTGGPTTTPTSTQSSTVSEMPTETETPTPTATPQPTGPQTLVIEVSPPPVGANIEGRNYRDMVEAAARYWEGNVTKYTHRTREIRFDVKWVSDDPDITVEYVQEPINDCGYSDGEEIKTTLGCAYGELGSGPRILIRDGFSRNDTIHVIKHELGHVFSLQHGMEPMPLMNETVEAATLPKTDAINRTHPWEPPGETDVRGNEFTVGINYEENTHRTERDDIREQVQHVVQYYNGDGGDHLGWNRTFTLIKNESKADITIIVNQPQDYISDEGSLAVPTGYSVDTDENLEYYVSGEITIIDIPTEHLGWHVGYWLPTFFGVTEVENNPPPFDEPEHDERESWWQ